MPLSYAAVLGGVITVLGTSTNLVVSDLLVASGDEPLGVFEVTGAEESVREQLPDSQRSQVNADAHIHQGSGGQGADFRADVERWLARAFR